MSQDDHSDDETDAEQGQGNSLPVTADGQVDYWALEPPDQTPETQYSPEERRADILKKLVQGGTPNSLNQSKTAKVYGVSQPTISKDVAKLAEFVGQNLGRNVSLTVQTLFEKTVADLRAEGEYKAAWDVAMEWSDWLADVGAIDYEPDRVEVGHYDPDDERRYQVVRPDSVPDDFVDADFRDVPADHPDDETPDSVDADEAGFTATPGSGSDGTDAIDTVDGDDSREDANGDG